MYSGKPISKDKYAARHKAERPASDYAKVPRELEQYIVDPTTKKRYLRGRFLGKVRSPKYNCHLNLNPASTASNKIFLMQNRLFKIVLFFNFRAVLQNATNLRTWRPRRFWPGRSSRKLC